jgi:hypothetical protein
MMDECYLVLLFDMLFREVVVNRQMQKVPGW